MISALDEAKKAIDTQLVALGYKYVEATGQTEKNEGKFYTIEPNGDAIDREGIGSPVLLGSLSFTIGVVDYHRKTSPKETTGENELWKAVADVAKAVGTIGQKLIVSGSDRMQIVGWEIGQTSVLTTEVGRLHKLKIGMRMYYQKKA